MDRTTWLRQLQRDCEANYDAYAPLYWETYGLYSNVAHQEFLRDFLSRLPNNSLILDAACGAGRYEPFLLEQGHSVIGVDQSQGMLARAKERFPRVEFVKMPLQEIAYQEAFDGVICMDAMENVCPEDWPLVLGNFHGALRSQGYLYLTAETIELAGEAEIRQAYERAKQTGQPVVYGEWPDEEVYHYHPTSAWVQDMVERAGYEVLKEGNGELWYYHVMARKTRG
jgi:SAM-dependent methyltransferase